MRKIKYIHRAVSAPIDDLITYRALPTYSVDHIDPFLFLNHHGPQEYSPNNRGLPFGPHPHRGFETLTFIMDGDIVHKDSGGGESKILAGGVQWMTAGSGLIHSEVSSEEFKKEGGQLEILQLWMNLPAKYKMTKPAYKGLQYDDITHFYLDDENVQVNLISGDWNGNKGPIDSLGNLTISSVEMRKGGTFAVDIPADHNIFFYVIRGQADVNGELAEIYQLVEFENNEGTLNVTATEDAIIMLGHAKPFNEPIIAHGPFVMNTEEEIKQAYEDFRSGKFV